MEKKEHLSPILRQELDKPLREEQGPSYGERLSAIIEVPEGLKRIARWAPRLAVPATMAVLASGDSVKPEVNIKLSQIDTFRTEIQVPSEVLIEQREFDQLIKQGVLIEPKEIVISSETEVDLEYQKRDALVEEIAQIKEISQAKKIEVERVSRLLTGLDEKIEDIYSRRRMWGGNEMHRVVEGDTLWLIAQKIGRNTGEIYQKNWWQIDNPNLIFSGQEIYLPESIYPSKAIKEIFDHLENDKQKLETVMTTHGSESPEAKLVATEIWEYWNTSSEKDEAVQEPVINIDPNTGEKGEWIAGQIKEFFEAVPNSGRGVAEVNIVPRENYPNWPIMGVWTYKDKGATITILEPRPVGIEGEKEWTRKELLVTFSHESLGHSMSLYSEGYNLRWLTPTQVVELTHEQTVLWDQYYRPSEEGRAILGASEEEGNAIRVDTLFEGGEIERQHFQYLDPEYVDQFEKHYNRVISMTLGYPFSLDELAQELNIR